MPRPPVPLGFAPPAERLAHRTAVIPLLDAFFTWAQATERKLSARSGLTEALPYTIKRRTDHRDGGVGCHCCGPRGAMSDKALTTAI